MRIKLLWRVLPRGRALLTAGAAVALVLGLAAAPAQGQPGPDPAEPPGAAYLPATTGADTGVSGFAGTGPAGRSAPAPAPLVDAGGAPPEVNAGGPAAPGLAQLQDNRLPVPDTTVYPASATVYFTRSTDGGITHSRWCTGWLYAPDMVATAAHCLYQEPSLGGEHPIEEFYAWPGRDGATVPFGSCQGIESYVTPEWKAAADANTPDLNYDFGAVRLDCTIGDTTGWFGLLASSSPVGLTTTMNGYPQDKPSGSVDAEQWYSEDEIRAIHSAGLRLGYGHFTVGGNSGSPVYHDAPAGGPCVGPCAVAVHSHGAGAFPGEDWGGGPWITTDVIEDLIAWRDDEGSDCLVDYVIDSQWSDGFQASVEIVNTSDTTVSGWTLAWTFTAGQVIQDLWNGVDDQQGADVTVDDAGWNDTILPGDSVSFGFVASHTGANPDPAGFALNGAPCDT